MKFYAITFAFLFLPFYAQSQSIEREVVASTGDFVQNTEGSLSFTVGESVIVLGNSGTYFLTQGFQQPPTAAPIPVEFGDFFAKKQNTSVLLNWFTFTERNSLRFDIERSFDANSFSKIGEIKASGVSVERRDYDFMDAKPFDGVNYYRLREVDFDGRELLSKIVSVTFNGEASGKNWVRIFPTTTTDFVEVDGQFERDATLILTDAIGVWVQKIQLPKSADASKTVVNLSGLANGVYFLTCQNADFQRVFKIVKQ